MDNLCDKMDACMFQEEAKNLSEEDFKTFTELYCNGEYQHRCMRRIFMNLYSSRPDKDLLPNGFNIK